MREKHQSVASCMSPEQGSNPQCFSYGMMIQPTEPYQPGPSDFLMLLNFSWEGAMEVVNVIIIK